MLDLLTPNNRKAIVTRAIKKVVENNILLIDLGVELLLVHLAIIVERQAVPGCRGREPGAGTAAGQIAGFDHAEHAPEIELPDRGRTHDVKIVAWGLGPKVDGAANRRGGRAINMGRAQVDVDLVDQLRINLLVGIDRIVARIVQRNAIEGQADAAGVETTDAERAARRTIGIVVLEADAGNLVDRVEDRLAGVLALDLVIA